MARPPRTLALPLREGIAASAVAVPPGPWPTVLDFLAERLPAGAPMHDDALFPLLWSAG